MKSHTRQSRPTISSSAVDYLIDHILGGYRSSHEGIVYAKNKGLLTDKEVSDLLTQNGERLIRRIIDFKIIQRTACVFFAALFGYMQLTCEDLEMRRARNGVRVRRKQETEITK